MPPLRRARASFRPVFRTGVRREQPPTSFRAAAGVGVSLRAGDPLATVSKFRIFATPLSDAYATRIAMNSPLPPQTLDSVTGTTIALTVFLRGIERRAAVFAELQCGEAAHGDQALQAIFAAFVATARSAPQADWPRLFWVTFLESPALAAEPLAPFWSGDFAPLARLDFAARAVVLARLVAQLDDAQGASVFGVGEESYRQALQRALPQRADGSPDGAAWLALRSEVRYALEDLSPERSAAVARMREAIVADSANVQPQVPEREPSLLNRPIPLNIPLRAPSWLSKLRGGGANGS